MSEPHVEPAKHSRIRSILAGVVGVIAVIGLLASVLAIWARWVVFNDDAVTKAAQQAVARPEVTDALALRLTDEVFKVVDAQSLVDSILPPALQPLAPAIVGGLRGRVDDALQNLLATDTAQELMVGAVDRVRLDYGALLAPGVFADLDTRLQRRAALSRMRVLGDEDLLRSTALTLYRARSRFAGPLITLPSRSNRDPWHGQSHVFSVSFQFTMQPKCVHTADRSCKLPRSSR